MARGEMAIRGRVKAGAARALSWIRADALIGAVTGASRLPVILGYHRVVEDFGTEARRTVPAMLTSRAMLEQQLDWIGQRFRFVSLDDLGAYMQEGRDVDRMAAVTFDDGYRDVYEHAFPLLRRKGIPSAVFVVTDLLGTERLQRYDRLYLALVRAFDRWTDPRAALLTVLAALDIPVLDGEAIDERIGTPLSATMLLLRNLPAGDVELLSEAIEGEVGLDAEAARGMRAMTWEMLAEMQRAGVTIGSHTRTHAWLTQESTAQVADELVGSRLAIERRLGGRIQHFAYPDGRFTHGTAECVAAAGYRFAYTTCTDRDGGHPLLTIPRHMLWQNSSIDSVGRFSPAIMSSHVHGVFTLVRACEQEHAR